MQTKHVAPLYERLPHGPHRLERREVLSHQRSRIHGAMVEAVAVAGYEATSVKLLTGLAGVSRRAFYEQFANKQDCFLATFDLVAGRALQQARRAYLAEDGRVEARLRASLAALVASAAAEPKAAALVAAAPTAGRAGIARQRVAIAAAEQLLADALAESGATGAPPLPIVRAVAGGVHAALGEAVRAVDVEAQEPARGLLRWALPAAAPISAHHAARMASRAAARLRAERPASAARAPRNPGRPDGGERARLLGAALRLAVLGDFLTLSAPQIADEAQVPVDVFFEQFDDTGACYAAAQASVARAVLDAVPDRAPAVGDWPLAVRIALARLLEHLARDPLLAHTIATGAHTAGVGAARRNLELGAAVAAALTAGAPSVEDRGVVVAGVAGAIWHTIGCQAAGGRVRLLPALSDYLTYVVTAPFIGAEAAVRLVSAETAVSAVGD